MPAVYCCGSCGYVISDSSFLIEGFKFIILKKAKNVIWTSTPCLSIEPSSICWKLFCSKCETEIGKILKGTYESDDKIRGAFLLNEGSYQTYEIGSATVTSSDEEYLMEEVTGNTPATAPSSSSSFIPLGGGGVTKEEFKALEEKMNSTQYLVLSCLDKVAVVSEDTFLVCESLKARFIELYQSVYPNAQPPATLDPIANPNPNPNPNPNKRKNEEKEEIDIENDSNDDSENNNNDNDNVNPAYQTPILSPPSPSSPSPSPSPLKGTANGNRNHTKKEIEQEKRKEKEREKVTPAKAKKTRR